MSENFVTCRHCGVGINYRCDHEDTDVSAEEHAATEAALAEEKALVHDYAAAVDTIASESAAVGIDDPDGTVVGIYRKTLAALAAERQAHEETKKTLENVAEALYGLVDERDPKVLASMALVCVAAGRKAEAVACAVLASLATPPAEATTPEERSQMSEDKKPLSETLMTMGSGYRFDRSTNLILQDFSREVGAMESSLASERASHEETRKDRDHWRTSSDDYRRLLGVAERHEKAERARAEGLERELANEKGRALVAWEPYLCGVCIGRLREGEAAMIAALTRPAAGATTGDEEKQKEGGGRGTR